MQAKPLTHIMQSFYLAFLHFFTATLRDLLLESPKKQFYAAIILDEW